MSEGKLNLEFDPHDLELGEIETLEELAGASLSELGERFTSGKFKTAELVALVYILGRRDNPEFTLEDARRVKIGQIELPEGAAPAVPPIPR